MPKTVRINTMHYFIMKIPNNRELQRIASTHLSDIEFKLFRRLYKDYAKEPYSFLVNHTTLPSDNPLKFRKNLNFRKNSKLLLARKSKQLITKSRNTKLNMIWIDKLLEKC